MLLVMLEVISIAQLIEKQKNIFNQLIVTGQMNVLENVLETSASLAWHFKVDARAIRRDLSVCKPKALSVTMDQTRVDAGLLEKDN